ncbi:MAG TPA: hypothetical protein VMU78_01365, partial [Methylocella sp.]|nr:hypothetical protein [Methylocella sp.]
MYKSGIGAGQNLESNGANILHAVRWRSRKLDRPSHFQSFDYRFSKRAGDNRMEESGHAAESGKNSSEPSLGLDRTALEKAVLLEQI